MMKAAPSLMTMDLSLVTLSLEPDASEATARPLALEPGESSEVTFISGHVDLCCRYIPNTIMLNSKMTFDIFECLIAVPFSWVAHLASKGKMEVLALDVVLHSIAGVDHLLTTVGAVGPGHQVRARGSEGIRNLWRRNLGKVIVLLTVSSQVRFPGMRGGAGKLFGAELTSEDDLRHDGADIRGHAGVVSFEVGFQN